MLQGGAQKAYHKAIDPGKQTFMEAAGIEPAQGSRWGALLRHRVSGAITTAACSCSWAPCPFTAKGASCDE